MPNSRLADQSFWFMTNIDPLSRTEVLAPTLNDAREELLYDIMPEILPYLHIDDAKHYSPRYTYQKLTQMFNVFIYPDPHFDPTNLHIAQIDTYDLTDKIINHIERSTHV